MRKSIITVVAAAALLAVGATGTSVAGSLIGSAGIKDNSIRSRDIHDGTIKTKDLRASTIAELRAAAGKDGKNGTDGKDGVANPSAAGAGYDTTWPADGAVHETVETCAPGEFVTGGGYSTFGGAGLTPVKDLGGDNTDIVITVSAPYVASDSAYVPISDSDSRFYADRWVVRGVNNGTEPQVVRAWALCAPLPN